MNYTDTTHYLFPLESKPGVVNVLPWLDELHNTKDNNTNEKNADANDVQSEENANIKKAITLMGEQTLLDQSLIK